MNIGRDMFPLDNYETIMFPLGVLAKDMFPLDK